MLEGGGGPGGGGPIQPHQKVKTGEATGRSICKKNNKDKSINKENKKFYKFIFSDDFKRWIKMYILFLTVSCLLVLNKCKYCHIF